MIKVAEEKRPDSVYEKPLPTPEPEVQPQVTQPVPAEQPDEIKKLLTIVEEIKNTPKEEFISNPEIQEKLTAIIPPRTTPENLPEILEGLWEDIQNSDPDTFVQVATRSKDTKYLFARRLAEEPTRKLEDTQTVQKAEKEDLLNYYMYPTSPVTNPSNEIVDKLNSLKTQASNLDEDIFVYSILQNEEFVNNIPQNLKVESGVLPLPVAMEEAVRSFWKLLRGNNNPDILGRALVGDPTIIVSVSEKRQVNSLAEFSLNKSYVTKIADKFAKLQALPDSEIFRIGAEFIDPTKISAERAIPQIAAKGIRFTYGLGLEAFGKEQPIAASSWYLFSRGIGPSQMAELANQLKENGGSQNQIDFLNHYGSVLQTLHEQHPMMGRIFKRAYRGRSLRFIDSKVVGLSDFTLVGNLQTMILDPNHFRGGFITNITKQFFGEGSKRLLSRTLAPLQKKIASTFGKTAVKAGAKLATRLGIEVGAGAATGGVALVAIEVADKLLKLVKKLPGASTLLRFLRSNWKIVGAVAVGAIFLLPAAIVGSILTIAVPIAIAGTFVYGLGTLGAAAGVVGASVSFFMGGLSLIGAEIAKALAYAFAILAGITVIIAFIIYIITASSYMVPPAPGVASDGVGIIRESLYIGLTKTVSHTKLTRGDLPIEVTYTIAITAKRGSLTNINFENQYLIIQDPVRASTPNPDLPDPPGTIKAGETHTFDYKVTFDESFDNSQVIDNFTVRADTEDLEQDYATTFASVIIGNPPTDCPRDWPLLPTGASDSIYITRGPYSVKTHRLAEAIDISATTNHPVNASHKGVVVKADWYGLYGKTVEIASRCTTIDNTVVDFISRYSHLNTIGVGIGQSIDHGATIGLSGATGNVTGAHLHYEFRIGSSAGDENTRPAGPFPNNRPTMDIPYLPKNTHGCGNACGISIP